MPNTSDEHRDKCRNPYKNFVLTGHRGKDLKLISKNLKWKFPDLPDNAKIVSIAEGSNLKVAIYWVGKKVISFFLWFSEQVYWYT